MNGAGRSILGKQPIRGDNGMNNPNFLFEILAALNPAGAAD
jgi:hypothetical protein